MTTRSKADAILTAARAGGRNALNEADGKAVLHSYGLKVPRTTILPGVLAGSLTGEPDISPDTSKALAGLQPPFAVKVVSPDILHKSDAGGVALNLADSAGVAAAIARMSALPAMTGARIEGWLVEEMIPSGLEMVVGGFNDPQFGPMLMVGLGGIFVEVLQDVSFRLCPITRRDAEAMLEELKGRAILDGVRGGQAVDKAALVEAMLGIGGADGLLLQHSEQIGELDINPLIVSATGAIAADARIILRTASKAPPAAVRPAINSAIEEFRPLFAPQTVAVLGASTKDVAIANTFIRRLKAFGYPGQIYPIHPAADEIEGLKAYRDLGATPQAIDYAYVAIGAGRIAQALQAGAGRCRMAQVITSGFAEVEDGRDLERELVATAQAAGIRVLGPNCLGTYSPRGGLTFPADAPSELGTIGIVSQSGGLTTDIIKRGQWRGLRFSGCVTIGNSADVTPRDLLEFYFEDPQTRAIGLYLEDIKDGRSFFDLMRSPKAVKPVVILKGGRSNQGRLAAASHTGALAGDERAWDALCAQTPSVMVTTVNAFIDTLLALQHFTLRPARPTSRITLFGNGGGSSVLGADAFAGLGLDVSPFEGKARLALDAMALPPGTSVANPIDTPVRTLQERDGFIAGEILDIVYQHAKPDAIAMHLNLAAFVGRGSVDPIGNLFSVIEQVQARYLGHAHFALALRSDGSALLDDNKRSYRERARSANVPVFDEIPDMAAALAAVAHLEKRLGDRN